MNYIIYNLETSKVERVYSHPLPKQNESFYKTRNIAEYRGELPSADWLSVDNIHEEIETWKEKKQVEKLDENGQPLVNEQGEIVYEEVEVEKTKTHIVCDLVAHFLPEEQKAQQVAKQKQAKYEKLVEKYIREKYSLSNELAILRQASTKVNEFNEYNAYAESCKARAKGEIYG